MRGLVAVLLVVALVLSMNMAWGNATAQVDDRTPKYEERSEYIVKWLYAPLLPSDVYHVVEHDPILKVSLIRVLLPYEAAVLERLQLDPNVAYIEKNTAYKVQAVVPTFDTSQQYYLDTTRLRQARELVKVDSNITIAVLDTGVDYAHPDLIGSLVDGANMFDTKKNPQDDHGHGTMVAGIIASTGKDTSGYEGIVPNIRIMPVKVMQADGRGDALKVSQGIRYAVDNGANIISLSVADFRYSKVMADEVAYAESKGVLIVAVTGNGGSMVGYPAALPTALAVGAVDQNDKAATYSNYGQEVDVVAPGSRIFAPQLGGGYGTSTGTSMAGPQVVGLAAMILSKYPNYTPAQVRNLLRYSAQQVGTEYWNERTGYGRIDALAALFLELPKDIFEPNDTVTQAKAAPLGKQVDAQLSASSDKDWFTIDVPHDGTLRIDWKRAAMYSTASIKGTLYDRQQVEIKSHTNRGNGVLEATVKKGRYTLKLEAIGVIGVVGLDYSFVSSFKIYDAPYGRNDTADRAYVIPLGQNELVGTISRDNQEAWFEFTIPIDGEFSFVASTGLLAFDPVVTVMLPNRQRTVYDNTGFQNGNVEQGQFRVTKGKLKIGIRNYYNQAVNTEYVLQWQYKPDIVDIHEPNNSLFTATLMGFNEPMYGYIASIADYDYFKFIVVEDGLYEVAGNNFPLRVRPSMSLYNGNYERIANINVKDNETGFSHQTWLTKGTYYVRLDARTKFTDQLYMLIVTKVDAAFRDLSNHWARESINRLAGLGIVNGYEDRTFRPNTAITRAEFTHLLVKSLGLKSATNTVAVTFNDVRANYWAVDSIRIAYERGLVTGYEGNVFKPDAPISRAEMVAILARGLAHKPVDGSDRVRANSRLAVQKFADINQASWYTDALSILIQMDWITGFNDGTFRPIANTSRGEVATMLERIWYK